MFDDDDSRRNDSDQRIPLDSRDADETKNRKNAGQFKKKSKQVYYLQNMKKKQTEIVMDDEQLSNEFMQVVKDVPKDRHVELLNAIKDFVKTCQNPSYQEIQRLHFEKIDSNYVPFPKNLKMTVENIIEHLEAQLGKDLKYWNKEENLIYLDDLRKIEPLTQKMYQVLYRTHKKDKSSPLMKDLVPKKSEKITKQLQNFKITDKTSYKEHKKNISARQNRQYSSNDLPIPENF